MAGLWEVHHRYLGTGLSTAWAAHGRPVSCDTLLQKGCEQNRTNQHPDTGHPKWGPESPEPSLALTAVTTHPWQEELLSRLRRRSDYFVVAFGTKAETLVLFLLAGVRVQLPWQPGEYEMLGTFSVPAVHTHCVGHAAALPFPTNPVQFDFAGRNAHRKQISQLLQKVSQTESPICTCVRVSAMENVYRQIGGVRGEGSSGRQVLAITL